MAAVLGVPSEALARIVEEVVARGGGALDGTTWKIETHAHVDALFAALVAYAGDAAIPGSPGGPFGG
jgi:hypothetical protein